MSDDLDDLLRRAMKTLDDQVPTGYFEGLPHRTLARLGEESSMQTSQQNPSGTGKTTGVPPKPNERDEDSGLHDIRSMASSTKMRLSSRRTSTSPPLDEDVLASSSAGWKAVALPEPAKMVSLPDIADLPSVEEVKSERKSKKELKAERISAKQIAKEAIAVESSPVPAPSIVASAMPVLPEVAPAPSASTSAAPVVGAGRFAQKQKSAQPAKQKSQSQGSSKTGLYALVGVGLAAAAGVGWYVSTQMKSDNAAPAVVAQSETTRERADATMKMAAPGAGSAAVTVSAIETAPPAEPKAEPVATGMATDGAAGIGGGEDRGKVQENDKSHHGAAAKGGKHTVKKDEAATPTPDADKKEAPKDPPKKTGGKSGEEGEPSFDALLKEAGVPEGQKQQKIVLEKKSLSSADIKKGMGSVTAKAQACYAGTQGTAQVRMTVSPSGQVQKVSVTGQFAGTPVGACVESAVKGASFPAWDGGPQSFGYSYLLAE